VIRSILNSLAIGKSRWVMIVAARSITLSDSPARRVTMDFPPNLGWDRPVELGEALRGFLKEHGIAVHRVAGVGLPANWVVVRTTSFPPVQDESLLGGMVDLASEELFAERSEDLVSTWQAAMGAGGTVVSIAACGKERIDQVRAFCGSAGLRADSVLPLAAGVVGGLDMPPGDSLLLLRCGRDVEAAAVTDGRVTWLRNVASADVGGEEMVSQLRLAVSGIPSLRRRPMVALAEGPVRQASEAATGVVAGDASFRGGKAAEDCLSAFAAGVAAADGANGLNFFAPKDRRAAAGRRARLKRAVAAGVVACLLIAWPALNWAGARSRFRQADADLKALAPLSSAAKDIQDRLKATDPWCTQSLEYLDAMRALIDLFPESGSIWLVTCEVDETGVIAMSGKARSRAEVLGLLDRISACKDPVSGGKQFDEIANHYIRQQTGRDNTVSFSAACRFVEGGVK
jgi:hypothetical protein